MDRYDSKFVVPVAVASGQLVQDLSEHSVLTIEGHVRTRYNNLYFDTTDKQCFTGPHPREGLRGSKFESDTTTTRVSHFLK